MFTTLVASLGLVAGQAQAPAPMAPMPTPAAPTVSALPAAAACQAAAEPAAPETKYFAEKLLEGTLAGQIMANNGIKLYGWTEMSYNAASTTTSSLPGAPFGDRSNEFLLNQNYLRIEKSIDTSKKEFQYGFRSDYILPGSDARFTIARDLYDKQVRDNRVTPIDTVQGYGEVFLPNLFGGTSVKVGRFYTVIGYETVDTISTPFLTRAYNFQYNPFTHTGFIASTPIGDDLTAQYGIVLGSDNFIGPTNRTTFIGGLKWAPKDGDTTLAFNTVITNPKYIASEGFNHFNSYNILLTHKLSDKLTYVCDFTYSHENGLPLANRKSSTYWYGFAQYLSYAHTEKLTSNLRVELFKDQDGWRTGFSGLYTEFTYGMLWKPCEALWIRPEVRYDHNNSRPFEGDKNMFVSALSVIIRW